MAELQEIVIPDGAWETAQTFTQLPPGSYLARVTKIEDARKNPEIAQLRVDFSAEMPDGSLKRLCQDTLTFGGAALGIALQKIQALGVAKGVRSFHPALMMNHRVRVHVKVEPYVTSNGESRSSLKIDIYKGTNAGLEIVQQPSPPVHGEVFLTINASEAYSDPADGPPVPF